MVAESVVAVPAVTVVGVTALAMRSGFADATVTVALATVVPFGFVQV